MSPFSGKKVYGGELLGIKIEFCKKITESRFLIVKDREKGIHTCYLDLETHKLISTEI
jgi:hypothetical protein